VLTTAQVQARLPTISAKTQLVLLGDAMYSRASDGSWYRLDGSAAPEGPSPDAAPLPGEVDPARGPARGDDGSSGAAGSAVSVPEEPEGSNPQEAS
jgi:hypothetical protein